MWDEAVRTWRASQRTMRSAKREQCQSRSSAAYEEPHRGHRRMYQDCVFDAHYQGPMYPYLVRQDRGPHSVLLEGTYVT